MRVSMVLPSQHDVCQPNEKPLSNSFGDTMAYHMYLGSGEEYWGRTNIYY